MDRSDLCAQDIALFSGIGRENLESILDCLKAYVADYRRGEYIWMAGERTRHVGIVLSGQANIYKDDILGNRSLLSPVSPTHMFGESFICAGLETSPVTVEAGADSEILLIPFHKIIRTCSACCAFHNTLIKNMLGIIAGNNLALSEKIDHISKKTTRQKLASYLLNEVMLKKSGRFSIGLNRQELADYLCVNRSALCRELSAIQSEGILSFSKNNFTVHSLARLQAILEHAS